MNTLAVTCEDVLKANDFGTHTVPSPGLYPHQWLWDSCFSAIGWAHLDVYRAEQEIYSLLHGQWHNGMIPHMIFDPSLRYAQDRAAWRSWVSIQSPIDVATSGITQPPVIAEAVARIGSKLNKNERQIFYKKVLPSLVKYHEWLYAERDPHGEGLVLQIHPYETGFDNTPPWMNRLREHSRPWWIAGIENMHIDKLINVTRRDTRHIPANQRMKNIDALIIWDVIRRLRRKQYDIDKILHRSLFIIEDVAYNSMFVRNNSLLKEIASQARIKLPESLIANMEQSEIALEHLWDDQFSMYFSRDFISNKLIREPTIAGLMPLYAGTISKSHADKLVKILTNSHTFWHKHPIPTVPRNVRGFDRNCYWQGPTWINTNWMIIDGLKRYGYTTEAKHIKTSTLEMLHKQGIWEYYDPISGEGLGSSDFSWTAALAIDMLNS
jgi:neutral trehalase